MIFLKYKYSRPSSAAAALVLAAAVALSAMLSGCDFADNLLDTFSSDTEATTIATQPKPTAPVKTGDEPLYGYDNISDENVRVLYGLIEEYADRDEGETFAIYAEMSERNICQALEAFCNDHPEIFWIYNCSYYTQSGSTYLSLDFSVDSDSLQQACLDFDNRVDEIISGAPDNASDFELELYVHDYIIDNCDYDYESAELLSNDDYTGNFCNAYGALVEGKAVCEGYAKAFTLLCSRLGIDCVNITGRSENENHMWNCVLLDGSWYQVDATWDDIDSDDEADKDNMKYMYFNLDDEAFYADHTPSDLFDNIGDEEFETNTTNANLFVPVCTENEYNYYIYKGAVLYDVNDSEGIIDALTEAAQNNEPYFYLTLDNSLDFESVSDELIYDGYLSSWISSANFNNFYSVTLEEECMIYRLEERNLLIVNLEYI